MGDAADENGQAERQSSGSWVRWAVRLSVSSALVGIATLAFAAVLNFSDDGPRIWAAARLPRFGLESVPASSGAGQLLILVGLGLAGVVAAPRVYRLGERRPAVALAWAAVGLLGVAAITPLSLVMLVAMLPAIMLACASAGCLTLAAIP